ncbi:MAG: elongation factor G, partial [Chloroflexota bacterium]|nr:elongation factor G [Chloroflexota bacterium]
MKAYGPDKIHNVGIFGHGGCGKTTLVEALLYTAKATTRLGRVEDGNTICDYDPDEQKRGMSINLALAPVEWKDNKINLIDVPGFADYASEVAAAMRVIDGAVIVVDAAAGIEVGTELVWQAARKANVPCIIFVNKIDRDNADFDRVVAQGQEILDQAVIPMQIPIGSQRDFRGLVSLRRERAWINSPKHDGTFTEEEVPADLRPSFEAQRDALVDKIAVTHDELIEKYLEGGAGALTPDELRLGLRDGIAAHELVPVFVGSATLLSGMAQLLDGMLDSFPSTARKTEPATDLLTGKTIDLKPEPGEPLGALVFKTLADPYVGKQSYVRVYSGELHSNSSVYNARTRRDERIGQLYMVRGKEQMPVHVVGPGDLCVITKLVDTVTNDTLCSHDRPLELRPIDFPRPAFTGTVRPHSKADLDKMGNALHRIMEEDPALQMSRDPITGETLLAGLGESHLRSIAERMKRKFDVSIDIDIPRVPYRETIRNRAEALYRHKKQTGGAGQFAEVALRVEPLQPDPEREDPLEFKWEIVGGVIGRGFMPAVEKGVREAMQEGLLAGNPVVDIRVAVFDGKEHPVDSKEIAFKTAGAQAFKQAAMKAQPVLMEPVYELEINVPDQYTGDIMSDLNTRRGRIMGMQPVDGRTGVTAHVPLAECERYATDLRAITQG